MAKKISPVVPPSAPKQVDVLTDLKFGVQNQD
jgi:hypothetical protein